MPVDNRVVVFYRKPYNPQGVPSNAGAIWVNTRTDQTWYAREIVDDQGAITLEWREKLRTQSDLAENDPANPAHIQNRDTGLIELLKDTDVRSALIAIINANAPDAFTVARLLEFLKDQQVINVIDVLVANEIAVLAPLATQKVLEDGTLIGRVGIAPDRLKGAIQTISRALLKSTGVKDIFDATAAGTPELSDLLISRHASKNRKVFSDQSDLTSPEGDTLGALAKANIAILAADEQELFYAVTDNVTNFSLGDQQVEDLFTVPQVRPDRILQVHTAIGRNDFTAVIAVRRRTATAPGYVLIASEYNAGPMVLEVIKGDGSLLRATANYQAEAAWINGTRVGTWFFQNVDDNGNFAADQLEFQNLIFGPSDAPKEVKDIHLNLVPLQSATGGVFGPRIILGLANVTEEVVENKEFPISSLLPIMRGVSEELYQKTIDMIEQQIENLRRTVGQHGSALLSVNGFNLVVATYELLMGRLENNEYTLDVRFSLSDAEATALTNLAGTNLQLTISGLSSLAMPVVNDFEAGESGAVFKFGRVNADSFIQGALTNGVGFLDVDFRYVSIGADGRPDNIVNERITRTTINVDSVFGRKVSRAQLPLMPWARKNVNVSGNRDTTAEITEALAGLTFRNLNPNRFYLAVIKPRFPRQGNNSGMIHLQIKDAVQGSPNDIEIEVDSNPSKHSNIEEFRPPSTGIFELICSSVAGGARVSAVRVEVTLFEMGLFEDNPTTAWN